MRLHLRLGLTFFALAVWSLTVFRVTYAPGGAAGLGIPQGIARSLVVLGPLILCGGLFWAFWGGDRE